MRARNKQWGVVVAVTVFLAGGLAACGDKKAKPVPRPTPPTIADAHVVALALSMLPEKPEDYVATDVRSAVAPQVAAALPAGSTITANEASWHPDGLDGGTITVTVAAPGAPTTTYTAIMIKEPSGWKVVATIPMTPTAPAGSPTPPSTDAAGNVPGVTAAAPAPTQSPSASPKPKKAKKKPATPVPTAVPTSAATPVATP